MTPGTPSQKKKKTADSNNCALSARFVIEAKWMRYMARFGSSAVQKIANIRFIYFALAFHVMMKTKTSLANW